MKAFFNIYLQRLSIQHPDTINKKPIMHNHTQNGIYDMINITPIVISIKPNTTFIIYLSRGSLFILSHPDFVTTL